MVKFKNNTIIVYKRLFRFLVTDLSVPSIRIAYSCPTIGELQEIVNIHLNNCGLLQRLEKFNKRELDILEIESRLCLMSSVVNVNKTTTMNETEIKIIEAALEV